MSPKMGRPTIFRPKDGGIVSGYISSIGRHALETYRARLRRRANRLGLKINNVSDGDVVEALVRGEKITAQEIAERLEEKTDAT